MGEVFIIAEAGVNHNGNPGMAFQLVDVAKSAGVDAVKFQMFNTENLVSVNAPKATYQLQTTNYKESQLEMIRRLELAPDVFSSLASYCAEREIGFIVTPFDNDSIETLMLMELKIFKIPSGEITNLPYLRKLGALQKDIILSTGMSTLEEVSAAVHVLEIAGTSLSKMTLLHCTTEYPAPFDSVNLRAMQTLREAFPNVAGVGYSDHTKGYEVAIAAVAMGATIIEKHFTLDKTMDGPDHKASLEPDELMAMVKAIRNVEKSFGSDVKKPSPSEYGNIAVVRKSIVASRNICKGERLTAENLTTKRPGTGLSPMFWDMVINTNAKRDFQKDEAVE